VTDPDSTLARKMHRTLEPYHGLVYFAAEPAAGYAELGIDDGRMGYFASRAAPMGPVPAEVVIATFFNFSPDLVRRAIPEAWDRATPEQLLVARLDGIDRALRRILGDDLDTDAVVEAAALARTAAEACTPQGRPLFAAHQSLDWPDRPHLELWHAITLLREFRGDGHIACLVADDVSGCEALVLHGAMGDVASTILQTSRARTDVEWAAAIDDLRERGWMDGAGELTDEGRLRRVAVEERTDDLAMTPWLHLGQDGCDRLRQLVRPYSKAIVASGTFGR
jgi:hypothetical protein